jgi:thiamine pyrophosphokinase
MDKCIIAGAGYCDVNDIKEDGYVIAADGGIDYLMKVGIKPNLVIGDFDSASSRYSEYGFETKTFPVEKDDTDMMLAIKEGLERGYRDFVIYGGMGGRFDHTFANLQCLYYLINHGAKGRLVGQKGSFVTMIKDGSINFSAREYQKGRKISVFAFDGIAYGVTEKGLKYTIENATINTDFPIGVSNEFIGVDAYIKVDDGILMIYVD